MHLVDSALHVVGALAVLHGGGCLGSAEDLGEVAQRGESQQLGDLGHGKIRFCKEVFAFLNPLGDHIVDGGGAVLSFEGMGQIILVHMGIFRQLFQSKRFLKMQINIPFDGSALAVA